MRSRCGHRSLLLAFGVQSALAAGVALPSTGPIIAAYGNWGQCDEQMLQQAENGADVVLWFAAHLVSSAAGEPTVDTSLNLTCVAGAAAGEPTIDTSLNLTCVAGAVRTLQQRKLRTTHLISIGGWCGRHPDTRWSGASWFQVFDAWNREALGGRSEPLFDGFDWDVEGCTQHSAITKEALDLMGEMSVAAKAAGYTVTMAPAQSYLDVETPAFNLQLNNPPAGGWQPSFPYHGRNTYAYLLARFGATTFDLVGLQLYESWSPAHHAIINRSVPVDVYVKHLVDRLAKGWEVDFSAVGLPPSRVAVAPEQLLLGLHVAYPGVPQKVLQFPTGQLLPALAAPEGGAPRGVFFWCAGIAGALNLTRELRSALPTRTAAEGQILLP